MRNVGRVDQPSYEACFRAQIGALTADAQNRLRQATVLIVGAGGLGVAVSSVLAGVGVGTLIVADPQYLEAGDFNRYIFARASDVGKSKVDALASFFEGRPHLTVVPILACAETDVVRRAAEHADVLLATSNTISSRTALATLAVRRRKAHVAAALHDGRERAGGTITIWTPAVPGLACAGCFLRNDGVPARGEALVAPVVATVGALAADAVVRLITADADEAVRAGNYLAIDLDERLVEPMTVLRRPDCVVCGPAAGAASLKPSESGR